MKQPTVFVVIGESACAFTEGGEIVETTEWTGTAWPDWKDATICDTRGAGGLSGFAALGDSLRLGEENAYFCGLDVKRVPDEVIA